VRLGELTLEGNGEAVYATVRGEIDLSNAEALRRELTSGICNDASGLVLDLSEVDYVDSAGLHLIHHLREDLRARGQRLGLVIPDKSVIHDVLRLAGIDWDKDIAPTVDAARRMLESPPDA